MLGLTFLEGVMAVVFFVGCVLLVLIVLLQKGRGGGLGAAFGGAGGGACGTRTGDVFTWITIVLTALFLLLAVGSALLFRPTPSQVAAVGFNPPPPGNVGEPTLVELSCLTFGATITYTIDEDDPIPGERGIRYEKPLTIEPGQTLKAVASRPGWPSSPVRSVVYGVEPELPATEDGALPESILPEMPATAPATDAEN